MPTSPKQESPRKFAKSTTGRIRWMPGAPHPLDPLFDEAEQAQKEMAQALTRLQQQVEHVRSQVLAQASSTLPEELAATEAAAEQVAWESLKGQKHYHHAQALLAALRRERLTARFHAAQAALDLATALLELTSADSAEQNDHSNQLRSVGEWRKQVAQFETKIKEIRQWSGRSHGWFEQRVVRRGRREYGPYLVYRWREADGKTYTVNLGRREVNHQEAPTTFEAGEWTSYRIVEKQQPPRSAEELITEAMASLVAQGAFASHVEQEFCTRLLAQRQDQSLSVAQLRLAYQILIRHQPVMEASDQPEIKLPDVRALEEFLAAREAEQAPVPAGTIGATKTGYYIVRFPYDKALVDLVGTIYRIHGGSGWRPGLNAWVIGATAGEDLFATFPTFTRTPAALALHARVQARAEAEERWSEERRRRLAAFDLAQPLPHGRVLYAHQREAAHWLIQVGKGILADEMGLGKTSSALVAAKVLGLPVHVICPVTLNETWLEEAQQVGISIQVHSWAKLPNPPEEDYTLICDEVHYAQEFTTNRTQGMIPLARAHRCRALFLLSGTPIKNGRPKNLYPLLYALDHPLARNKHEYERYYCEGHPTRFTWWNTEGAAHLEELHQRIKPIVLRRTKEECLELPPKVRKECKAQATDEVTKRYQKRFQELRAIYLDRLEANEISSKAEPLVLLNQLRQAGSKAKIETALVLTEELLREGQQVVLFTSFVKTARELVNTLRKRGVAADLLIGETSQKQRAPQIQRFQDGQLRVLVNCFGTGGEGITLTAARTVILVDLPWTEAAVHQAEDRLHRVGQKFAVTSIWITYGQIDEKIKALLPRKAQRSKTMIEGGAKSHELKQAEKNDYSEMAAALFGNGA